MKTKTNRYVHVAEEVYKHKAARVLEVGTWNGDRAIEMADAAVRAGVEHFTYVGFDLFESMTPEKSREEFNVKRPMAMSEVNQKLDDWAHRKRVPVSFFLIQGNTRETLPLYLLEYGPACFDLAWIDGGHSVETIESDWDACARLVRPGGIIMCDDYYSLLPDDGAVKLYGCNRLIHSLKSAGRDVFVFPEMDPVRGGGFTQAVRVRV